MDVFSPLANQGIALDYLISVHYYEFTQDFSSSKVAHDCWEFLYVDNGQVEVSTEHAIYLLRKGDIIFHKPEEVHSISVRGAHTPNLILVNFCCHSPAMRFFEHKILRVSDSESLLLAAMIREARNAYATPLDAPPSQPLERRENAPFGAEQLIRISLEQMLIDLIRKGNIVDANLKISSSIREKANQDTFTKIITYLENNVHRSLTLDDVCQDNLIGRSNLQKMFRAKTGGGVMEYFCRLKIEAAKRLIRQGGQNFTEIAHALGFSTIHYFSRRFKAITGMTPTEYASSVKLRAEEDVSVEGPSVQIAT